MLAHFFLSILVSLPAQNLSYSLRPEPAGCGLTLKELSRAVLNIAALGLLELPGKATFGLKSFQLENVSYSGLTPTGQEAFILTAFMSARGRFGLRSPNLQVTQINLADDRWSLGSGIRPGSEGTYWIDDQWGDSYPLVSKQSFLAYKQAVADESLAKAKEIQRLKALADPVELKNFESKIAHQESNPDRSAFAPMIVHFDIDERGQLIFEDEFGEEHLVKLKKR